MAGQLLLPKEYFGSAQPHVSNLGPGASPGAINTEMDTMVKERAKASFPTREMTYFLDGGATETHYLELANTIIRRDPKLMKDRFFDLTGPENRAKTMEQIRRSNEILNSIKDPKLAEAFKRQMGVYDRSYSMRSYVHRVIFRETIWAQGTKEQFEKYAEDIAKMRIIGCFAMTELGHSSFLRGLETHAIFDKETQEFVIHSASLTATKWWIGMAGEVATHTVALCNLIIDGKVKGLHWFVVPLRNPNTGELLPGVSAGFVGARAGRAGLDNGWIQFSHVRVPRENMLMRFSQVLPDGTYKALPNQSISYSTLIGERLASMEEMYSNLSQALTIAIRYGAVRRQGGLSQQILDYQSHQYQLFPSLATVFGILFTSNEVATQWNVVQQDFQKSGDEKEYLSKSADFHATSAALKAYLGWWCADALESARRTLGGHAFSSYGVLAGIIGDYGVITTGGGDNTVLAQQCSRYLLTSFKRARESKLVGLSVRYLLDHENTLSRLRLRAQQPSDLLKTDVQIEAFTFLSTKMIMSSASTLALAMSNGASTDDAWNANMVDMIQTAKPHAWLLVLRNFARKVELARSHPALYPVLKRLCDLFALHHMLLLADHFLEHNYFDAEGLKMIRKTVFQLCREIRPDAVALVDSFNFPDWMIKSPLGRYDGNIYEAYFEEVVKNNPPMSRPPYWEASIKPLTAKL